MKRVAVIGAGISGLGAAYLLSGSAGSGPAADVVLYERDDRLGGHACTVRHDGLALDCGFLVCNERTYPLLLRLFGELGVRTRPTEMSFAVTCRTHGLEYAGRRMLAQAPNLRHRGFARLIVDIGRWLRVAERALEPRWAGATLDQFVDGHGLSGHFRRHFLAPFSAALWSTDPQRVLDIPASFAVRFFQNHGLVGWQRRTPWQTVVGGSASYVSAVHDRLGPGVRASTPVRSIQRDDDGVDVRTDDDHVERYDHVVVATHADQALGLLADPTPEERDALGRFRYTTNETVLHTDPTLLPSRPVDVSAWNFALADCADPDPRPTVTYSLNRLQGIESATRYSVTLNRTEAIAPASVIDRFAFAHPVFDEETLVGQQLVGELNASGRTSFAGAHLGYGFHEDGLRSAVAVAERLGVTW